MNDRLIDQNTTLFWFRRDLRLEDNAGLYHALKENRNVLPIFIFDTNILDKLEDKADKRVEFIHQGLLRLKSRLEELGSSLLTFYADPVELLQKHNPKNIYANRDYEPYARERDDLVEKLLTAKGITFRTFKDHVIFDRDEIIKDDRTPFKVFTPYSKKWKVRLTAFHSQGYPCENYFGSLYKIDPQPLPSLKDIGFTKTGATFPDHNISPAVIERYHEQRDLPAIQGTTRLSVHLRFGTVSVRKVVQVAQRKNETLLNELIWCDFYQMILWHFPHTERAFKPSYDKIVWRNDPDEFQKWCEGKTGYPIVDAGMRELNQTGFMHNRVRMVTASFLTKHLLIDWRWGEAYFAQKLLDFDLAANNGGWQWASGSGCDAVPYFRVFNPHLQTAKYDPGQAYIRQWVPEFGESEYPAPMVDHSFARKRVLRVYKEALAGS